MLYFSFIEIKEKRIKWIINFFFYLIFFFCKSTEEKKNQKNDIQLVVSISGKGENYATNSISLNKISFFFFFIRLFLIHSLTYSLSHVYTVQYCILYIICAFEKCSL